jgi:hypothetical protein
LSIAQEDPIDIDIPIWKPTDPGERLLGRVVTMKPISSKFGNKTYPYLEIETEDGHVIGWHASATVAVSQLKQVKAQVGDTLDILYRGTKGANGYKDFKITSDRQVDFDWNEIGGSDDDAA